MFGLPEPRRIRRRLDAISAAPGRELRLRMQARQGPPVRHVEQWLTNNSGYRVRVIIHEPDDDDVRPAVILVPGRDKHSTVFRGRMYVVSADELASLGIRTVLFDPVGRGSSWGHDDFCGSEGQDSLRAVLDFVHARRDVDPARVGLCSFSLGLSLCVPLLAREGDRRPVRFLMDWEGPADRDAILRGGPLPPAARTALARDPDVFWDHREPLPWMDDLPCSYIRVQARQDHSLDERGAAGAIALVAAAARGRSPETRLNDNPPNVVWRPDQIESLRWAPRRTGPLNRMLLSTIRERLLPEQG
jgi:hypothetical protein